jgi:hypothetical protein
LFTALLEIAFSDHFEGATKLKVDASHRRIIGCVTKISRDVKGLFNAESVVLQKAPSLFDLRNDFAETHWDDLLFEIKLVAVVSKELEKQPPEWVLISWAVSAIETDVSVEGNIDAVHDLSL